MAKASNKKKFEVVLFGKSLRKITRAKFRKMNKTSLDTSPLGIMRPRQMRKDMAAALKIPFQPRYNGPVYSLKHTPYENKKGYIKYKSELVNAK